MKPNFSSFLFLIVTCFGSSLTTSTFAVSTEHCPGKSCAPGQAMCTNCTCIGPTDECQGGATKIITTPPISVNVNKVAPSSSQAPSKSIKTVR